MLSSTEIETLSKVSTDLSIDQQWLYDLIMAESGWNPQAKNPGSTAKGLIQFIDSTAQDLGFINSQDLIDKYPTIVTQLRTPVYNYLKQYSPFRTKQSLYMAVFYPAARYKSPLWTFPAHVQKANQAAGIDTVKSYIDFVDAQAAKKKINFNQKGELNTRKLLIVLSGSAVALVLLNRIFKK